MSLHRPGNSFTTYQMSGNQNSYSIINPTQEQQEPHMDAQILNQILSYVSLIPDLNIRLQKMEKIVSQIAEQIQPKESQLLSEHERTLRNHGQTCDKKLIQIPEEPVKEEQKDLKNKYQRRQTRSNTNNGAKQLEDIPTEKRSKTAKKNKDTKQDKQQKDDAEQFVNQGRIMIAGGQLVGINKSKNPDFKKTHDNNVFDVLMNGRQGNNKKPSSDREDLDESNKNAESTIKQGITDPQQTRSLHGDKPESVRRMINTNSVKQTLKQSNQKTQQQVDNQNQQDIPEPLSSGLLDYEIQNSTPEKNKESENDKQQITQSDQIAAAIKSLQNEQKELDRHLKPADKIQLTVQNETEQQIFEQKFSIYKNIHLLAFYLSRFRRSRSSSTLKNYDTMFRIIGKKIKYSNEEPVIPVATFRSIIQEHLDQLPKRATKSTLALYSALTKSYYSTLYNKSFDKGEQLYTSKDQANKDEDEKYDQQKKVIPIDVFLKVLRRMKENAESQYNKTTERNQDFWNYLFLLVCFMTGARKTTATKLKFSNFTLMDDGKQCFATFKESKTKKNFTIYTSSLLYHELMKGKNLRLQQEKTRKSAQTNQEKDEDMHIFKFSSRSAIQARVEQMRKRYPEFEKWEFSMHDTRRLFARQIEEKHGKHVVQQVLKHTSLSTTDKYLDVSQQKTYGAFDDIGVQIQGGKSNSNTVAAQSGVKGRRTAKTEGKKQQKTNKTASKI